MPLELPAGDFRAFIFDCDGTLADNMHLHYEAWVRAMADFGGSYPEELFYEWGGVPTADIVHRLNERFGLTMNVGEVVERKEHYYRETIPRVGHNADVIEIVRAYHGRLPLAVASGGHRDLVDRTLHALGIHEFFDAVVTAEDYKRGKPSPDPFLKAAELLGVAAEHCLVFEDTATGVAAARAAGMQCVLV
ncbi:MAG: beta-phosphoglucomutase family hydrolase [Chthoniobacterales bacterium]|jgi:beta-phosphoglucomutase family hydrolase